MHSTYLQGSLLAILGIHRLPQLHRYNYGGVLLCLGPAGKSDALPSMCLISLDKESGGRFLWKTPAGGSMTYTERIACTSPFPIQTRPDWRVYVHRL